MAKDYANKSAKKHGRHSSRKKITSPSWSLWVMAILLVGLFALSLYYLSQMTPSSKALPPKAEDAPTPQKPKAPSKPRFEFYTILAENEAELLNGKPQSAPNLTPSTSQSPAATSANTALYQIQIGAFKNPHDADRLNAELTLMGYDVSVTTFQRGSETWYRVRLGPYPSLQVAQTVQKQLQAQNYNGLLHKANE